MKQLKISLVLILLLVAVAPAQNVEQNLRKHVAYLASAKLEGRRTGEQGATAAAKYVESEFKNSRLKAGLKTTFLQPFPYVAGVTLGANNALRIVPADTTRENKMEVGINWMPLGYSPSADIPSTEIVFAGFGVTVPEANYDDYKGLDVRDKIVLIFDSTPDAGNPHSAFARFNIHTKANIAKDKGAKAIILIAADGDFKNDRLARLSYDRTLGETALPVVGISRGQGGLILGASDTLGLDSIVWWVLKKNNGPIAVDSTTGKPVFMRTPKNLEAALSNLQAKAQLKINLVKKTVDAFNVIGILPGTDPQLKSEAIIIGAHYDHLGRGGAGSLAANSTDIHHGADDNASGTSAVLELARQFAKEKKNKRTLIFMAFGGEEEGLLGSKHYVNNPVWPLDKTIAMINLDMVGRLKDDKLTIGGVGTASEWNITLDTVMSQWLRRELQTGIDNYGKEGAGKEKRHSATTKLPREIVAIEKPVASRSLNLQRNEDGFGPSDHSSFYGKKIPVLFFFTGTHPDYHKPSDTFDKINYAGLAAITDYVGSIVRSVDAKSTRPTYAVEKSSAPMGQVRMSVSLGTIPSYGDTTDGMILDGVRDNSPAAKAGLRAGDKVVKLAGKDVRNAMDYTYVLSSMKAGEEYEVVIKRGTETLTLKIIPAPAARR